jgi:hypothetical protein
MGRLWRERGTGETITYQAPAMETENDRAFLLLALSCRQGGHQAFRNEDIGRDVVAIHLLVACAVYYEIGVFGVVMEEL